MRPAVFILHATSPGNYQGWIAVSGLPEGKEQFKEFMRRVRKAVGGNDKNASHATRLAGTENFKVLYAPEFPVVTTIEAHPGRVMTPENLESMGLLTPAQAPSVLPTIPREQSLSNRRRTWPDYARALAGAPPNRSGTGPDRSMADFTWSMTAIDWGWSIDETAKKLPEVSERARQRVQQLRDEGYPLITAQNAAREVERNDQKRGRG